MVKQRMININAGGAPDQQNAPARPEPTTTQKTSKKSKNAARAAAMKLKGVAMPTEVKVALEKDEEINEFFKVAHAGKSFGPGEKGIVALKEIKRGERIFAEKPVLKYIGNSNGENISKISEHATELKKTDDEIVFDFAEQILMAEGSIKSADDMVDAVLLTNTKFIETSRKESDANGNEACNPATVYSSLFKLAKFDDRLKNEDLNSKFSTEQLDVLLSQYVKLAPESRSKVAHLAHGDDFDAEKAELNLNLKTAISEFLEKDEVKGTSETIEKRLKFEKTENTLKDTVLNKPDIVKQFATEIILNALFVPSMEKFLDTYQSNALPTNNIESDPHKSSLCPTIARFNHSCCHNAIYSWRADESIDEEDSAKGVEVVIATKDIAEGETITVTYLPDVHKLTTEERAVRFTELFGFTCRCELCEGVRTEQAKMAEEEANPKPVKKNKKPAKKTAALALAEHYRFSDEKRKQIADLDNIMASGLLQQIPLENRINVCADLHGMQNLEYNSANPAFIGRIAFQGLRSMAQIESDNDKVQPGWRETADKQQMEQQLVMKMTWALRMRENCEMALGKNAPETRIAQKIVILVQEELPMTEEVIDAIVKEVTTGEIPQ